MAFWPFVWLCWILVWEIRPPSWRWPTKQASWWPDTGRVRLFIPRGTLWFLRKTSRMPMWKTENVSCLITPLIMGLQTIWEQGRIPVIPRLLSMKIRSRRSIVGTSIIRWPIPPSLQRTNCCFLPSRHVPLISEAICSCSRR